MHFQFILRAAEAREGAEGNGRYTRRRGGAGGRAKKSAHGFKQLVLKKRKVDFNRRRVGAGRGAGKRAHVFSGILATKHVKT